MSASSPLRTELARVAVDATTTEEAVRPPAGPDAGAVLVQHGDLEYLVGDGA
jgi:hypothetical protein